MEPTTSEQGSNVHETRIQTFRIRPRTITKNSLGFRVQDLWDSEFRVQGSSFRFGLSFGCCWQRLVTRRETRNCAKEIPSNQNMKNNRNS